MKKYIWLCCMILLVAGCGNYPQTVEFNVSGENDVEFYFYVGDTLGEDYTEGIEIIPVTFDYELENEHTTVWGIFYKQKEEYYNDTLIVDLYVDGEFVESDTSTTDTLIEFFYPD